VPSPQSFEPIATPMNKDESIKIVIASNNHFALMVAALVKSIEVHHTSGEKIDLYVIDDGISEENKRKIRASGNEDNIRMLWFLTRDAVPEGIAIPADKSSFPITTYLRLFAPYILPKGTKKYIYLDVDMILKEDISKLYNVALHGQIIGAVQDRSETAGNEWGGIPNYRQLGIAPETLYFNAGLMVVDLEKWIENDVSNAVIKCIHDNTEFATFPDQYGLNVVLANKWQPLDKRWNSFPNLDIKEPFLIHFLAIKPFYRSYDGVPRYQEEFYKYLRMTPWQNHKPLPGYVRTGHKALNKLRNLLSGYLK
jgi:lipopolysaccharide biosynthesis glycosyltransferase